MNDTSQTNELRPIQHLRRIKAALPNLSEMVEAAYKIKAVTPAEEWPSWCFIPRNVWVGCIIESREDGYLDKPENLRLVMQSHILCAWRYGQGIYEFDPELLAALVDSDAPGKLPANVLMRLPEWCIYVPVSGLKFYKHELYGFFASLDFAFLDVDSGAVPCLNITEDTSNGLLSTPLPLTNCTISEAFEKVTTFYKKHKGEGVMKDVDNVDFPLLAEDIKPLISILLYLCSNAPEIDNKRKPGTSPFRIQQKRVKGGLKWFPADGPTVWSVGTEIGETLRNAGYSAPGTDTGHSKRPHLRRGHWHGYWSGPRKSEEQTFGYKWLPPMMVAAD